MASLEAVYTSVWKSGKTVEAREDAHRYVTLIEKFKADLKARLMGGQMAESRIKELEGKPSRRIWG